MGSQERLTFEDANAPTLIACEHRHRYRLASGLVDGLRVLDLCCGSGYGAQQMAEHAHSVYGVDIDAATIDAASAAVGRADNVWFEAADALEFVKRDDIADRFDVVVCFEGLEHIEQLQPVLDRLHELAQAGVRMILSVPNSKGLGEENEFHRTDFSWEDALEKLGSLPGAVVLTQYLAEGSVICVAEPDGPPAEARIDLEEHEPEYANHYIVLAGFDEPPVDGLFQLEGAPLSNRYMRDLEAANTALRRVNQRFMRERLGKTDSAAGTLAAKYEQATAKLAALEVEHAAWLERCAVAEKRNEELTIRVDALRGRVDSVAVGAFAAVWQRLWRRR